jgi:hypothetical protein
VDYSAEEIICGELGPDEQLLWAGRPRQGLVLRGADTFLIPFSLMWGGFAIFWETMVVLGGAPWFFALWGVPFVLVGLHLMIGRFFVDAWQRDKTFYGVTSERVIIISGVFSRQVKSLNVDTLTDVSLSERANGKGTIIFGPMPPWWHWHAGANWPGFSQYGPPTLDLPEQAREVYDIIRGAQKSAKQR